MDEFATFWGDLHNWTDRDPDHYRVLAPRKKPLVPLCYWPHFSTTIKWNGDVIPCCTHRQGDQYRPQADARVFGNIFQDGFDAVWNSEPYRQARRIVSNPECVESEPELKDHFCYACPIAFETDRRKTLLAANQLDYEQVYTLNERGRPVRRSEEELDELRARSGTG